MKVTGRHWKDAARIQEYGNPDAMPGPMAGPATRRIAAGTGTIPGTLCAMRAYDDPGRRVLDGVSWAQGAEFWVLVLGSGCWVLGSGFWVLGAGCRVPGAGCWAPGAGCWAPGVQGESSRYADYADSLTHKRSDALSEPCMSSPG